ncbi:rod-binding protein [Microvirga alba]|uniref:Rod-binding protein n=1 Tax=Microvirga alba TaxID=2791025 RepID=A0A931FQA1_9HYPH|nr:rod-binding protein [Microvirga alba]
MGINPPSDIVQDVALAANPMRYQAAANRLSELSRSSDPAEFGNVLNGAMVRSLGPMALDAYSARTAIRNDAALSAGGKPLEAYQKFEAFILQSFIETMLPKDAENTFGKGTAGGVWKSMMAEQIGTQIAKAGGIGIAKKVFAAHPPASLHEGTRPARTDQVTPGGET